MATETKRRAPIQGGFAILVIPKVDVELTGELTIPMTMQQRGAFLRVVGDASNGELGCCSWAFTESARNTVSKNLRALADWIEKNTIDD